MKRFFFNFLTSFVGTFVGVFAVKHFLFPGNNHAIPDWAYSLIAAFFLGLYSAYKGRNKGEENHKNE